jgi:hypothetical protein
MKGWAPSRPVLAGRKECDCTRGGLEINEVVPSVLGEEAEPDVVVERTLACGCQNRPKMAV